MDILFFHIIEKQKLYAALVDNDKTRYYVFEKDLLKSPKSQWSVVENKETKDIVSLLVKIGHESIINPKEGNVAHLISFFRQVNNDIDNSKNLRIYKDCTDDLKNGLAQIDSYKKDIRFNSKNILTKINQLNKTSKNELTK